MFARNGFFVTNLRGDCDTHSMMKLLLACLAFALQDPDERIRELIRKLATDEKAALRELVEIGKPALPHLKKVGADKAIDAVVDDLLARALRPDNDLWGHERQPMQVPRPEDLAEFFPDCRFAAVMSDCKCRAILHAGEIVMGVSRTTGEVFYVRQRGGRGNRQIFPRPEVLRSQLRPVKNEKEAIRLAQALVGTGEIFTTLGDGIDVRVTVDLQPVTVRFDREGRLVSIGK